MRTSAIELILIMSTNLVALPAVVWAFMYKKYIEASTILFTAIVSFIFHLCWGTDFEVCLFDEPKLWWLLDFLFVFILISVIGTYIIEFPKNKHKQNLRTVIIVASIVFGLVLEILNNSKFYFANVTPPEEEVWPYIVLIIILALIFAYTSYKNGHIPKIDYSEMAVGLVFLIFGIVVLLASKHKSWFYYGHAVWHVFIFISIYFFMEMRELRRCFCFPGQWRVLRESNNSKQRSSPIAMENGIENIDFFQDLKDEK